MLGGFAVSQESSTGRVMQPMSALGHKRTLTNAWESAAKCPLCAKSTIAQPALLRLELMQQDGVALAVQTHRHSTHRLLAHIAFEGDALALEVGHKAIEVLNLECNRSACGVTRFFLSEVGEG